MIPLIGLSVGCALLGVLVVVLGFFPAPERGPAPVQRSLGDRARAAFQRVPQRTKTYMLIGFIVGIVLAVVAGWPVLAVAAPFIAGALPTLLGDGGSKARIEKLSALHSWTSKLSGLVASGSTTLEQSIIASYKGAPEKIRPQLGTLIARINAGTRTRVALRAFADELDDATADRLIMNLLLTARQRGDGLKDSLEALAESLAEEVRVRQQTEADRAKPRSNVRFVAIFTLAVLALVPLGGTYMDAYRTPVGQLILCGWLVLYAIVLVWMHRKSLSKPTPRLLTPLPKEQTA